MIVRKLITCVIFLLVMDSDAQKAVCRHCAGAGRIKVYEKCPNPKCRRGNVFVWNNASNDLKMAKCQICSKWNTDRPGYKIVETKMCVYCDAWLDNAAKKVLPKEDSDFEFFSDKNQSTSPNIKNVVSMDNNPSPVVGSRLPPLCKTCRGYKRTMTRCQNEFHKHFQKKLGSVCPDCGTTHGKIWKTCSSCNGTAYQKGN